jgi:hypothetical protein
MADRGAVRNTNAYGHARSNGNSNSYGYCHCYAHSSRYGHTYADPDLR